MSLDLIGSHAGYLFHHLVDGFDAASHPFYRGFLKQHPYRQLDARCRLHPRHHSGGEQGVAAQLEEVIVHPT